MTATLTAAERGTLRTQLEARRGVLRAELQAKLNSHDNPALLALRNRMEETDDWAVADLETALDIAEVARDAAELREVEVAFTRMHDGSYGTCLDCTAPIPFARLEANPSASRCIACQEKAEAGRRHGSASL
ncbi:MAG: TraR/DksA family transcriptional regulator [Burkholderiales bacterium]|nr:TraR/DksA family transcriptional regulator [Burkholderiales bacterium]